MRDKELRLALVCYGGISLAVYMHGIAKEIWRLARASRDHQVGAETEGGGAAYAALFAEFESAADIRLRVLPDIIAGASAGGINGIFLGQAIATGQSLDPLTELWLSGADSDALLDPEAAPSSSVSKLWAIPLAWYAAGRDKQLDEGLPGDEGGEVRAKLARFVRARWFEPPFGGPAFVNMLLDAFQAMADAPRGPRLLPLGQPLDLFVTVTDFRGHPERLALNSPPEVVETEHRLVIPFTDHGLPVDTLADHAELAFAARATSSFPGAFPPFTVGELDRVLATRKRRWRSRKDFLARVLPRQWAAGAVEQAALIDGSVLANAPFRPAIDALRERPARHEVDRRFVYVDPSPGMKIRFSGGTGQDGAPGFFQTILGALSELPRKQPIRDNLEALSKRSDQILRMRGIIANIRPEVEAQVQGLFGNTLFLDRPTPKRLFTWRRKAQVAAARQAGYGHAAYGHLKVTGVIALVTELLYHVGGEPGPARWSAIRRELRDTLERRGIDTPGSSHAGGANEATIDFLRAHDLGFRIRRLRLLARRLSELEAEHADADFDRVRDAIYDSLGHYLDAKRTEHYGGLRRAVRAIHDDAGPVLDALATAMDLTGLDAATDRALADAIAPLAKPLRRQLLLTYLGFPFYDIATLPLLQGEGLDEFDPIKIDRISPDDATAIRSGGAEATLKGIQFNSFGAFFSRAWRENDYLWGRLHGADRLIDIVLSALPDGVRLRPGRVAALKRQAFLAILDEEEPRLTAVPTLFTRLRAEIG